MSRLETLIRSNRVLLMDGAMGTELQRAGGKENDCFELWNLTHPERIRAVHQAYVNAGAQILLTNTFQANPVSLAKFDAAHRLDEIFCAALENARMAAGPDRFVLADIGPSDKPDAATAAILMCACAGADAVLLETWSETQTIGVFADAIAQIDLPLPLLVSFTFWRPTPAADLRTFAGCSPERGGLCPRRQLWPELVCE
jgi:methionine synthase I (cobalamin-dependent)